MKNKITKKRREDIGQFFELIESDAGVIEAFFLTPDEKKTTRYYGRKDRDRFIEDVLSFNTKGYTCYAGIQPRDHNFLGTKKSATGEDVTALRFLYLDIDPERPKGTNATNKEKKHCFEAVKQIRKGLMETGYKSPIVTSSGNGYWLLMPIPEIEITDENRAEIDKQLKAWGRQMKEKFETKGVEIDTNVHDLRRITKIPGTKIFNKPHTAERPQRISKIISKEFPKPDKNLKKDFLSLPLEKDKPKATNGNAQKVTPKANAQGTGILRKSPSTKYLYKPDRVFKKCHLIQFLKNKGDAGDNIPHSIRLALSTMALAMGDLNNDLAFIKKVIGGCPNFSPDKTGYYLTQNQDKCVPYGCDALRDLVSNHFKDFEPDKCKCEMTPSLDPVKNEYRKVSPIRYAYLMETDLSKEFEKIKPSKNPMENIANLKIFIEKYLSHVDLFTAKKFLEFNKKESKLTNDDIKLLLEYGSAVIRDRREWERLEGKQEEKPIELSEEDKQKAIQLLKKPSLLYDYGKFVGKLGVVREKKNVRIILLALASRLIDKDLISLIIKGGSSAGKSWVVKKCLDVFPEEFYYEYTIVSNKSLLYTDKDLKNKFIIFYEFEGQKGDDINHLIRTLQSEGCLKNETTVPAKNGGFTTQSVVKEGPTGFITTTTNAQIFDENETRIFSLFIDESEEQTKEIMKRTGEKFQKVYQDPLKEKKDDWKNIQRVLEPLEVKIPYAEWLSENIPANKVRMRRDFKRILLSIKVCAILHQYQRERITEDDQKYIVATLADYSMVRRLLEGILVDTVQETTPKTEELIKAVKELYQEKIDNTVVDHDDKTKEKPTWKNVKVGMKTETECYVTMAELIQKAGGSRKTIKKWILPAVENGYIEMSYLNKKIIFKPIDKSKSKGKGSFLPEPKELLNAFPELAKEKHYIDPITGKRVKLAADNKKK